MRLPLIGAPLERGALEWEPASSVTDAVRVPGVCETVDEDLVARVSELRKAGVGVAPAWDLLFIDEVRIRAMRSAWVG